MPVVVYAFLAYSALCVVRFLPVFCTESVQVVIDEESNIEYRQHPAMKGKAARRLDLATWQMAWDRFALAAAMVKMIPFRAAMQYKQVVLEIGMGAAAEDRKPVLAIIYDEMVRKEWENKAGMLGDGFEVSDRMAQEDEVILKRARRQACF